MKEKMQARVGMETSKPYLEGIEAFKKGIVVDKNPYPSGSHNGHTGMNDDRYRWFMGWYDTRFSNILSAEKAK